VLEQEVRDRDAKIVEVHAAKKEIIAQVGRLEDEMVELRDAAGPTAVARLEDEMVELRDAAGPTADLIGKIQKEMDQGDA
ncbi:hypothetical protein T484DRAFT_1803676, partial [Baffinella frigidus]